MLLKIVNNTLIIFLLKFVNEIVNNRFELRFKYRNNLIYFIIKNNYEQLYILIVLKQKIFQLTHD